MKKLLILFLFFLIVGCAGLGTDRKSADEQLQEDLLAATESAGKWSDYDDLTAGEVDDLDTFLLRDVSDTALAATGTQKEYPWSVLKSDLRSDGRLVIAVKSTADADPTVNDDVDGSPTSGTPDVSGYYVGDIFINGTASPEKYWVCVDNSNGAAQWDQLNPEQVTISSNGYIVRTGAGAAAARTFANTNGEIDITNPAGTAGNTSHNIDVDPSSGNPTLEIAEDALQVKYDSSLKETASGLGVNSFIDSMIWTGSGVTPDGTNCADASSVLINSGARVVSILCADDSTSYLYGDLQMPDSWDYTADVTFEIAYIQTASDTNAFDGDFQIQCRTAGTTVGNTWGAEAAAHDDNVTGSNGIDHQTSATVDTDTTTPADCAAGDHLFWRWNMSATGTTTAVGTLHIIGVKMEYTTTVGD